MSNQSVTGTLKFPRGYKGSSEEIFHTVLSRLTPERYQLKRMTIYETPMSAELEYVKTKTKSRQVHRLKLILSKNKKDLDFRIFPSKHMDERRSYACLLYTSPSPRDLSTSRMPSSA